jgi:hypothetical protein
MARVTGTTIQWDAPSIAAGSLRPYDGPMYGSIRRGDETDMPSLDRSRTGTNRTPGNGGERGETTRAIRAVLDQTDQTDLTRMGDQGVADQVFATYGIETTPGYVNKVRRNGHGRS